MKRRGLVEFAVLYFGLTVALIAIGRNSDAGETCAAVSTGMITGKFTVLVVLLAALAFLQLEKGKLGSADDRPPDHHRAAWLLWRTRLGAVTFAGLSYSWDLVISDHAADGTCGLGARLALALLGAGLVAIVASYPIQRWLRPRHAHND